MDLGTKAKKKTILKRFLKGILQGKSPAPKLKNLLTNRSRSLHAATPKSFKFAICRKIILRMQPRHQATLTQSLQCDLQLQNQKIHRSMHTGTTTRSRTQRRNPLRPERSQPPPPHIGGTFHRRLQPLYMVKYTVSCSGLLSNINSIQNS